MIDTHSHPIMGAMASMGSNLYDEIKPLAELEQWIIAQDQAGAARAGDIIVISGASSGYWEQSEGLGKIFNQGRWRSEEHTSELQSLMRNSYAVFRLTKK